MYIPPILKHYQYGDYLRIDGEERLYVTPTGNLHSVTTILSVTDSEEDKKGLENWRRFVGEEKANEIVTEATTVGSLMHENLENLMQGKSYNQGSMPIRVLARNMADVVSKSAWPQINEVWGIEVKLYYDHLWAGTSDLVGVHNGVPAIMDYKNSRKPKKKEHITNYFLQGCAYALAHNLHHGTDINKIVLFVCVRENPEKLQYQEFEVQGEEFNYYRDIWISRVNEFYRGKI